MIGKSKRYVIKWRHRVLDTPEYPYHGSGYAYGRTRRQAVADLFAPPLRSEQRSDRLAARLGQVGCL